MRLTLPLALLTTTVALTRTGTVSTTASPQSRELVGNWQLWRRPSTGPNATGGGYALRITVARTGDSLVATATNGFRVTVRANGDSVTWRGLLADGRTPALFLTRWSGDSLVGLTTDRGATTVVWFVRDPGRAVGAPTHPRFKPTTFSNVFTGTLPAALRLYSGDTVQTETLDAGGRDSTGTARGRSGNPLTGPFWINGSLP